jgi:hypothetical protein
MHPHARRLSRKRRLFPGDRIISELAAGRCLGFADAAADIGYGCVTSQLGARLTGDPRDVALRDDRVTVGVEARVGVRPGSPQPRGLESIIAVSMTNSGATASAGYIQGNHAGCRR